MATTTERRSDPGAPPPAPGPDPDPAASERRGRMWLLWSFIFCPCHLPLTMAVLATVFGGTALGAVISRNTLAVGVVFGLIYAVGLGIGFRHIRAATAGRDCSGGTCERS